MKLILVFLLSIAFGLRINRELYDPKDDFSNDYSPEELKIIEHLFKNLGGDDA